MISRIHGKLGTAGFVVAIVALVAAMAGGAWAAAGLNGKQKKEVKKIAKQFAGKNGAPGATGPVGPAGTAGTNGTNGKDGAPGKDGAAGADGKSVVLTAEPNGLNCKEGGTKVEVEGNVASKKFVCNGEPWTAGGVLPSGETETGTWGTYSEVAGPTAFPISFEIPLAATPEFVYVKTGQAGTENVADCPGFVAGVPTAEPDKLCVYAGNETGGEIATTLDPTQEEAPGVTNAGALLFGVLDGEGGLFGVWAVTAE